jgi:predicted nucleic acid-binding protein
MRWYLDASVALHAVLAGGDCRARQWLDAVRQAGDEVYSSTLLHLELTRVLRRERLAVALSRPVLERVNLVSIDDGVLRFAAAIEPHVKSLDAIHLATCSLLGAGVTVATHDANMLDVASALGLDALDPLIAASPRQCV